jgi:hypothetical protein
MTTVLLTHQPTGTMFIQSASLSIGGYCVDAYGTVQCDKCGCPCVNTTIVQNNGGVCDSCVWKPFCDMWSELVEQQSSAEQALLNENTVAINSNSNETSCEEEEEDDIHRNGRHAERLPEVP